MKLPFDEISELARKNITEEVLQTKGNEELQDDIEDLLIMSYALGWGIFGEEQGIDTPMSPKGVSKALETKTNGKTYKDYLLPHLEDKNLEGVYKVVDTEAHRMYTTAQNDNAKVNNFGTKTWRTMEDLKVRESHRFLDKVTVGIDEKFYTQDGDSALYPGGFAEADKNCGCRCILTYSK